ncbi:MAG: ubiquinone biosynthesis protein COQ4 [Myxococcota bacterium]|jgi:ubiquinone biosynthesis protein COQ4
MTRLEILREIRAAMSDPDRIGDVPALKSELGGTRARPEIEAKMADVRGYHPRLDLDALAAQPAGTFGHEYARFLQVNGLSPIVMTGNLDPEMVARNAFVVRYGIIHDMVHVLTGFDTSWPGEIGVWSFIGAQGYSTAFRITGVVALLAALVRCPLRLGDAWRAFQRGRELAVSAPLLLTMRLEEQLHRELDAVRAEMNLSDAGNGYLPAIA